MPLQCQQFERCHFDYCWPGDAKIVSIEITKDAIAFKLDRFTISLDDPGNKSKSDMVTGECSCTFKEPKSVVFKLWDDTKSFKQICDIHGLIGCSIEDADDMATPSGHYFELTGWHKNSWFELQIFSECYSLSLSESDYLKLTHPNPVNPVA